MKTNFSNHSANVVKIIEAAYRDVIPDEQLDRLLYKREKCKDCLGEGTRVYVCGNDDVLNLPCPDCAGNGYVEVNYEI